VSRFHAAAIEAALLLVAVGGFAVATIAVAGA